MQRSQSSGLMSSTLRGRAGDAGVVDQHVEAAKAARDIFEEALDVSQFRNVTKRVRLGLRVDVAHMDFCTMVDERLRDGTPDARAARRDEHAHAFCREIHSSS